MEETRRAFIRISTMTPNSKLYHRMGHFQCYALLAMLSSQHPPSNEMADFVHALSSPQLISPIAFPPSETNQTYKMGDNDTFFKQFPTNSQI